MHTRVAGFMSVVSIATLGALSACGTGGGTSSSGGQGLAGCSGIVTVASELPTSGKDADIGGGTEKGVKLAVDQANANHFLGGCTVNYIPKDDASVAKGKHDPDQGARNMTELANNQAVIGVVGPFNSSVAVAEMPISSAAGLVQISPSNTDPGLTIAGSDPAIATSSLHKNPNGKITYFRVISIDTVQAKIIAGYAYNDLHLRKVYDVSDNETYGQDLSNYFDQNFSILGGVIVKRDDTSDYSPEKFRALVTGVQSLNPDGVFCGCLGSTGSGVLWGAIKQVGLNAVNFVSGDGTVDPQFFKDAGPAAATDSKTFASSAPDTTVLESAKSFNAAFKAAYNQDVVAYSSYGFDAMNILLTAIKKVLVDNGGQIPSPADFRAKVVDAVAAVSYDGTIGHTQFDSRGDTLNHSFSIYAPAPCGTSQQCVNGKWVGKETRTG